MSFLDYMRPINHSETLLINERSNELSKNRVIHRFGVGQSPFPAPKQLRERFHDYRDKTGYLPVQGLPELCEAVAQFHHSRDHVEWDAKRILIEPGSKLLIYAILASFSHAEVVLIRPSWVSYQPQAELCGHTIGEIITSV